MKEMYIEFIQDKHYKVLAENLENAIEQIKHYESHTYDLYAWDGEDDIWGWWDVNRLYHEINFADIVLGETIYDLTDYKFTYPQEFCKTFEK